MYKKVRFYIRFIKALASKYYPYLIIGILLSLIAFFSFPYLINLLPSFRFTQKVGLIGRYTLTSLPEVVAEKVSIGLTTLDPSGQPGPGVAKSWEISPDGKTLTFAIDTELTWHDKTKLVSTDIKYQFEDALIEYPDPTRIVFKLKDPFSPLPTLLSKPIIRYQTSKLFKSTKVIGLGSYKITAFKSTGGVLESLTLNPTNTTTRQPVITYKFYFSATQAKTAFKLGLVDRIEDLPELGDLTGWPNTILNKHPSSSRYVGLFFNTQSPNLSGASGKNLRLAISYAINKDRWPNRAISSIQQNSWVFNPETKRYDLDLKRAKDLLKKVEKIPDQLIIHTVPAYIAIAEEIKSDLTALGLAVEVSARQDLPPDFDLLLIAQAIPHDPDQYNLWHSTQSDTNLTRLNNPRIDKLLEDGRKTYTQKDRLSIYMDFQKYLAEEVPVVFLFYPELYSLYRK